MVKIWSKENEDIFEVNKFHFFYAGHMTLDHGIGVCGISVAFSWHSGESSASSFIDAESSP
jgi:hypothetical protein